MCLQVYGHLQRTRDTQVINIFVVKHALKLTYEHLQLMKTRLSVVSFTVHTHTVHVVVSFCCNVNK